MRRLQDRAEAGRIGLGAELLQRDAVFHLKHRFAGVDEHLEVVALVVLEALFVDREVEAREQFWDLTQVVLEADRHPVRMRHGRERLVEHELGLGGDVPTHRLVARVVRLHDVELHRVEAHLLACRDPRLVHLQHEVSLALVVVDVRPVLVVEDFAERVADEAAVAGLVEADELLIVGPVRLDGSSVDVADRVISRCMDRLHRCGRKGRFLADPVEVDVEDVRLHALPTREGSLTDTDVDPSRVRERATVLELVLPSAVERGPPDAGPRRAGRRGKRTRRSGGTRRQDGKEENEDGRSPNAPHPDPLRLADAFSLAAGEAQVNSDG
jgi:hypothetical protein